MDAVCINTVVRAGRADDRVDGGPSYLGSDVPPWVSMKDHVLKLYDAFQ